MGGAYFLLLSSLGLAMTVQVQGCLRPVGTDMTLKDEYILLTEFPEGITVAFACDVGYETAGGSGKTTCTNGVWSPLTLKCQRKSCGSAGEIENGEIHYDEGIEFGAKATVTCNEGFDLVGNTELICGAQGWLNRLPVCEVLKCDPPSNIVDGMFSPVKESYAHGEVVQYSCIADYTVDGPKVSTCSDDGKFKPDPPKCIRVKCEELIIRNAKWKAGSRPPYTFKSSVTYECEKGFTLKGDSTITCGINSQWTPDPPECIPPERTTKPPTTTTTTRTTTTKAPMDRTPDTNTPTDAPDSGGNTSGWLYGILAVGVAVVAGIVGKIAYDQKKKRKRISHQDKKPANNGEAELCAINVNAGAVKDDDEDDVKDDVNKPMNTP